MKFNATHHVALGTPNPTTMETFYTETLGLEVVRRWEEVGIVFLAAGDTVIELIGRDDFVIDPSRRAGLYHFAFHVESVDETFEELVAAGITIDEEPRNYKDVRIAFFRDPDGNLLEIVEEPRK